MQSKLIHEVDGQKTFAVILSAGDEVMACLQAFAAETGLSAASLKAIGAFERAELAFLDWQTKEYSTIPVNEQVEVASLIGDIALGPDGQPALHLHAVLGRADGSALAGHLKSGVVRPTLEVILTESPAHLRKREDPESGLTLISLAASSGQGGRMSS
ncbi:DNA-binding protein [Kaistia defluvii]|uniref:PPC domain-containing DNA-binding protein n=1 Tax=Kaistia defluvii TaxID=410841 RepID=UPI00224EAF29|nr:PPC domain-containing DNA-binding protein [Kaistia defluvii]MCX5517898.1 DNA-binding protein [Kaistia defluvii]